MNDNNGLEDYEDSLLIEVVGSAIAAFIIAIIICIVIAKVIMAFRGMLS